MLVKFALRSGVAMLVLPCCHKLKIYDYTPQNDSCSRRVQKTTLAINLADALNQY